MTHGRAPEAVVESARVHLARWTGPEFARRYVSWDSSGSSFTSPAAVGSEPEGRAVAALAGTAAGLRASAGWRITFRMGVPETPCSDRMLAVHVDSAGALVGVDASDTREVGSAPCALGVGRDEAVAAARDGALAEGIRPWQVELKWMARWQRFVWSVSNTLADDGGCAGSGETYLLDAGTGRVLERSTWSRSC